MNSSTKTALVGILVIAFGWGVVYTAYNSGSIISSLKNIGDYEATVIKASITPVTDNQATEHQTVSTKSVLPVTRTDSVTVIVGGDMMFDRGIRAIGERNGYESLFDESIKKLFDSADIVMANLEGPITDNPSKTLIDGKTTDSFTFTFSPLVANALKEVRITAVSLANNHTDNFGLDGYLRTQENLESFDIIWFGNPWNSTSTSLLSKNSWNDSPSTTFVDKNGVRVAFIGYHGFHSGVDNIISEIHRATERNAFVIVMPHWGEEYTSIPSEKMRLYAKAFVDAGADAVIGAHPHIVADQEWIGDTPVFYSLGNLLFDQYFSEETKHGLLVKLHIRDTTLESLNTYDVFSVPGQGTILE